MIDLAYERLDPVRQEIRVLTLQPGAWNEHLICELEVVSLDISPRYYALSYVWGDEKIRETILLCGQQCTITRNLFLALRRLRTATASRTVWVDAVCINQSDKAEKSIQVAMMGKIYSSCTEALLWLGEDPKLDSASMVNLAIPPISSTAKQAFDLLKILAADEHLSQLACFETLDENTVKTLEQYVDHFEALRMVTHVPWWTRVWVLQEAVLPSVITFLWASESCPYQVIYEFQANFGKHANTCCAKFWYNMSNDAPLHALIVDINAYHGVIVRARRDKARGVPVTLTQLRERLWTLNATHTKDLFYGLLGMVDRWGSDGPLVVDYTLSDVDAISRACLHCIRQDGDLTVLRGSRWLTRLSKYPTWFPNISYGDADRGEMARDQRYKSHCQNLSSASPWPCSQVELVNNTTLILQGIKMDRVASVGSVLSWDNREEWLKRSRSLRKWMRLAEISVWPHGAPATGSKEDFFWRLLIHDCVMLQSPEPPFFRKAEQADYRLMREVLALVANNELVDDPPDEVAYPHMLAIKDSRFMITESGTMGLVPAGCEPGDDVWILHGSKIPHILRPSSRSPAHSFADASIMTHSMVGEAYVHGLMYDEHWAEVRKMDGSTVYLI